MDKSKLLSLDWKDITKGFVISVIMSVVSGIYKLVDEGGFSNMEWQDFRTILLASIGAGITYVFKNFITNSDGKLLKSEDPNPPLPK